MRIELEDENKKKQQEEHTCQQLSQKHESDLTKKEKRLLEKEKLKVWIGKENCSISGCIIRYGFLRQ